MNTCIAVIKKTTFVCRDGYCWEHCYLNMCICISLTTMNVERQMLKMQFMLVGYHCYIFRDSEIIVVQSRAQNVLQL